MSFLSWVAICLISLMGFPSVSIAEGVSLPAQTMMRERRKTLLSLDVKMENHEMFIQCDECKAYVKQVEHVLKHETDHGKKYTAVESACHKFASMFGHDPKAHCPALLESYLDSIEIVVQADKLPDVCHLMGLCPNAELDLCDPDELVDIQSAVYRYDSQAAGIDDRFDSQAAGIDDRFDSQTAGIDDKFDSQTAGIDDRFDDVSNDFRAREDGITFSPLLTTGQTSPNITFVQISDVHLDQHYVQVTCTQCLQIVCCHKLFGDNENVSGNRAGPFGDFNCDANVRAYSAILDFVLTLDPVPEFFVYAGDSSVHAILELVNHKLEDNRRVNDLLVEKLRDVGPIYPMFGNHETIPQSIYFRPMIEAQIILESLSEQWPNMFNATDEQIGTIREHGYYVAEINPTLWILNFNSLYSYSVNIFALLGRLDPVWKKQKDFVRDTLLRARSQSAKVLFISHIKARHEGTHEEYADYMDSLLADFSDVIILQLYGHEHDDSFLVHRDPSNKSRAVGVSLAAPPVTPFYDFRVGVNPAIRVFTLERDTWTPLDYTQYYVDLEEANRDGTMTMKVQYQFTEEYNLPDLSPASFAALSDRIHTNWPDFQKYERNFQVLTSGRDRCSEYDMGCRRKLTCHTRTAKACEFSACLLGL